ncbi:hypothetical protein Tco_0116946 [Tanacetum coccineum]
MEILIADQIALDDALVAPADRLKIGKCNLRLSSDVTSKEATLQVVYDVLKLTPFYKAFQVTADAPEIYMQEFWARMTKCFNVKEFQERCNIKAFQEWYEHVGPEVASSQDGKVSRWQKDYAWLMISRCSKITTSNTSSRNKLYPEINDHYNIFTKESQEYELKTKDKA